MRKTIKEFDDKAHSSNRYGETFQTNLRAKDNQINVKSTICKSRKKIDIFVKFGSCLRYWSFLPLIRLIPELGCSSDL